MKNIIVILIAMVMSFSVAAQVDTFSVQGKAAPTATIPTSYYTICAGDTVHIPVYLTNGPTWDITYTNGINSWTINGITSSPYYIDVTLTTPGALTYAISGVWAGGCSGTYSGFAQVTVTTPPTQFTLSCDTTTFCTGSSSGHLKLNGSVNGETYWMVLMGTTTQIPGTATLFGNGGPISWPGYNQAATIQIMAQNPAGCQNLMNGSVTLTESYAPPAATTITGPTSICAGSTNVTFSTSAIPGADDYVWSVPIGATITYYGGTYIIVNMGNTSGNVTVAGLNDCGGGNSFVLPVTVNPKPVANISASPSNVLCLGDNTDLTATSDQPGSTFAWSTGQSGATITVAPVATTNYTVTVTGPAPNFCESTTNITVTVNPVPTVSITMPTSTCLYEHLPLISSPVGGTWTGLGVGGDSLYTEVCGAGTHTLTYTYTNGFGCDATATHYITVNPLPLVSWTTVPGPFTTATPPLDLAPYVSPAPGSGLSWSFTGPTGSIIGSVFTAGAAGPGTHLVVYNFTHLNGCSNNQGVYLTINTVGIDDIEAVKDVVAFPNPTNGELNLSNINTQVVRDIYVVNDIGQVVYIITANDSYMTMDLGGLSAGKYSIVFADDKGNFIGLRNIIKNWSEVR